MNLLQRLLRGASERYSLQEYINDVSTFSLGGMTYQVGWGATTGNVEQIENHFAGYVQGAYKANGVVFAVALARHMLFTEARFQWQRIDNGRPGDLFGTPELAILETPWPNGTTGELLARMDQDVTLAGNFYAFRDGNRLRRLRPDWVEIVLTAPPDQALASDVAGYRYTPGGGGGQGAGETYGVGEVVHWSPIPDPEAQFRGMSWLTPILREVQGDKAATAHKLKFFDNAATLGPVVSVKETVTADQFREFIKASDEAHRGVDNAYKTMYLGGGADVTMRTADMRQLDFKVVQGAGETRIAAAGRVPPIIVGLSEGLQAATYSNYGQARRAFGDHWARPSWRSACAALEPILRKPPGTTRLWYDDRDIAFLREDQRDAAEIQQIKAATIRQLVDAGYVPESVIASVEADDRSLLKHSGLYSVQLTPPGPGQSPNADPGTESEPTTTPTPAPGEQP